MNRGDFVTPMTFTFDYGLLLIVKVIHRLLIIEGIVRLLIVNVIVRCLSRFISKG